MITIIFHWNKKINSLTGVGKWLILFICKKRVVDSLVCLGSLSINSRCLKGYFALIWGIIDFVKKYWKLSLNILLLKIINGVRPLREIAPKRETFILCFTFPNLPPCALNVGCLVLSQVFAEFFLLFFFYFGIK